MTDVSVFTLDDWRREAFRQQAEVARLTEALSYCSGHDRASLDHLAEAEAWREAVEDLRAEAETKESSGRIVLLAFCDEVERRHFEKLSTAHTGRTDG